MAKDEYCLVKDNDAHDYVIPADRLPDWETFCNIPSDDERSWDLPEWAEELGCSPSRVWFSSYRIVPGQQR